MKWTDSLRARRGLLIGALAVPAVLLGALSLAQESKPKAETAGKKFKNIKVLKDLPADKLIPVMHEFNRSLGVECTFCHIVNADHTGFEKDDKPPKEMARKMILMANDINKHQKILEGHLTCYMCHHGHPEPEAHAPSEESR